MTFFMPSIFLVVLDIHLLANRICNQQCNNNITKRFTYHQDSSDDFSYIQECN